MASDFKSEAISILKTLFNVAAALLIVVILVAVWYYSSVWRAWQWDADAAAIYLTGIAAAAVGIWALFSQRIISRRQCTFEHIARSEADHDLIKGRQIFRELTKKPGALKELALPDKEQTPEFQAVVTRLNWFELISIGIQRGTVDYEFYRRWLKSGTIRTWQEAEDYIKEVRKRQHNDMLFYEFERLKDWLSGESRPPRSRWWGVFF